MSLPAPISRACAACPGMCTSLYTKLLAGEDTYKLYLRKGLTGAERLLLDPERITIAEGNRGKGTNAIGIFAPSNDLKYLAVTIVPGGSENNTETHVIETASGREAGDVVPRCCIKSNPIWLPDSHSFVYGRLQTLPPGSPATEVRQKYRAYLHVLGSDPEKDQAVFGSWPDFAEPLDYPIAFWHGPGLTDTLRHCRGGALCRLIRRPSATWRPALWTHPCSITCPELQRVGISREEWSLALG
jgi:hypothetical protein